MKNEKRKLISGVLVLVLLLAMATTLVFAHDGDNWVYGTKTQSTLKMCYSHFYCPVETHSATARMHFLFWEDKVKKQAPGGKWAKAETGYHPIFWSTDAYYSH